MVAAVKHPIPENLPAEPSLAPVLRNWARAWRPRERVAIDVWAERSINLPQKTSSEPGRYRIDRVPYVREPLRLAGDPGPTEKITLVWATQTTKTTLLQVIALFIAANRPLPLGLFAANQANMRKLRDKLRFTCEASPALRDIAPPRHAWNDLGISFRDCMCYLGYSGSFQTLSGESCGIVLKTELSRWLISKVEGSASKKANERVKAFFRHLILQEGTPTDENCQLWAEFLLSDQRRFHVPCLKCGHYQELRFWAHKDGEYSGRGGIMGLQDAQGRYLPVDEVAASAWCQCEAGGCRNESWQKEEMLSGGVWCPKGQTVVRGRLEGKPLLSPRHAGFQLSSLYSPKLTFGDIAAEYLESRDDRRKLQGFWNDWLALQFRATLPTPEWKKVGRRLAAGHSRGTVAQQALFLTSGADVQDHYVVWTVRAWGEGCTSWLVDFGICHPLLDAQGQPIAGSDLDQLDEILDRDWPLVRRNQVGRDTLRIRLMNIDMQGHRQWEVFQWALKRQGVGMERIRLVAGDTRIASGEFYRLDTVFQRTRDGKEYPGGLKRWRVNVDVFKEDVRGRFDLPLEKPGAWFLTAGIVENGIDYLRQICNESKRPVVDGKGRKKIEWVETDARVGNHFWDCSVYERVAAEMVVGQDWKDLVARYRAELGASTDAGVEAEEAVPRRVDHDDYSAR